MKNFTTSASQETAFSVSQLNRQIQQLLEASLPWILVEGEISNLAKPGSGHWYFSLKDDKAQIRCAMFKGKNSAVRFRPKDGDMVRLRARVTFYGPRGDCQLSVESMESAGEGALQQAFERLKTSLQLEGLFDAKHKKPLPTKPERVAIITSPIGAAVRDMIIAFRRRFPLTELTILPSLVQGQDAAKNILRQLQRADDSGHFDAIVLGRGGGSLEDLWSFNDEALARAVFMQKRRLFPRLVMKPTSPLPTSLPTFAPPHQPPPPNCSAQIATNCFDKLSNKKNNWFVACRAFSNKVSSSSTL